MSGDEQAKESTDVINGALYLALIDLNRLFAAELDLSLEQIFVELTQIMVTRLGLALAWVGVLRKGEEWISLLTASGPSKDYPTDIRITSRADLPQGHGPIGFALRTGKLYRIDVDDGRFAPWQERARQFGLGGGIAVPFSFPNGDQGIISLNRHTGKLFLPDLEELIIRIGEDLTLFLRHRREREVVARLLKYQEATGTLLHRLLSVPSPDVAYEEVVQILIEKTDALGAWISVPDGEHLTTVTARSNAKNPEIEALIRELRPSIINDGSARSTSTASRAFWSRRPVVSRDDVASRLEGSGTKFSALSLIKVAGSWPILVEGEPIAVLVMVSDDPLYFGESLQVLIGQLIDGICVAIQNFETQMVAQQITQLYQALLVEGDLLFTARNEVQFLNQTCERLIDAQLFKTVWIGRGNERGTIDRLASSGDTSGDQDMLPEIAQSRQGMETASMTAINTGETVCVPDYVNDPRNALWSELAERSNWRSCVSAPIDRSGKTWGVLSVMSDKVDGFSPEMIGLLTQISQMIAHGLNEIDLRAELNAERDRQSWLASHDILTGLPNRRGLEDRISEAISRSQRHETILAVGMLDLDDFKVLNDRHGHDAGDTVLRELTCNLRDSLRQTDLLARIGGDEFVLVLEDVRKFKDLSNVLNKLENVLCSPLRLPNGEFATVGGSLGLSIYTGDDTRPDALLRQADQALYKLKAKKGLRSRDWAFYAPSDPEGISIYPHVSLIDRRGPDKNHFKSLLHSGGLRVLYQPILDLRSGKVVGAEALSRLVAPNGELYQPSDFVEELSFGDQRLMTDVVLRTVLSDLASFGDAGDSMWCSVNVLPELLSSDSFLAQLREALSGQQVAPSRITLEVLEGGNFLSMEDAWRRLVALKELGVDLAIDDIGSAYSSLLRLRDLPIDKIKLDREFVRTLSFQPNGFHFLNAMTDLSRALNVDFVAEGAETPEILDALATLEVPMAQGYSISGPLDIASFKAWLPTFAARPRVEHPDTALGLYAFHIRQTFFHHQRIMSGLASPSLEECRLQEYLERLGYAGTAMDDAHHRYHEALKLYEGSFSSKPNPYLRRVEETRESLRESIVAQITPSELPGQ